MGKKHTSSGTVAVVQSKRNKDSYEGERLEELLQSIQREIKRARFQIDFYKLVMLSDGFFLRNNSQLELMRLLESLIIRRVVQMQSSFRLKSRLEDPIHLAVIIEQKMSNADCNPRWLTNHVPTLAISRKVPLILVKDKEGSLRLGELVKLKRAIATGVKANGSPVNRLIGEVLQRTK